LANKNVWYATCSEIANYYLSFIQTQIESVDKSGFTLKYIGRIKDPLLTLLIKTDKPIQIISPSGKSYEGARCSSGEFLSLINIRVESGRYQIKEI
jgi:hypothetical protein